MKKPNFCRLEADEPLAPDVRERVLAVLNGPNGHQYLTGTHTKAGSSPHDTEVISARYRLLLDGVPHEGWAKIYP